MSRRIPPHVYERPTYEHRHSRTQAQRDADDFDDSTHCPDCLEPYEYCDCAGEEE